MLLQFDTAEPVEAPESSVSHASAGNPRPPRRILLVDDAIEIRQLYSYVLAASGYQVDTADDGEAGWQAIHAESFTPDSYDLLITDNNMPKLSGIGLIKKVRSAGLNLPVILASGTAATATDTEPLRLAAILPKPYTPDELVQTVKKVLHTTTPHSRC